MASLNGGEEGIGRLEVGVRGRRNLAAFLAARHDAQGDGFVACVTDAVDVSTVVQRSRDVAAQLDDLATRAALGGSRLADQETARGVRANIGRVLHAVAVLIFIARIAV